MALGKYCFCYPWEAGVTLIGKLQMNAALFFWAQFSTMEPLYLIIHLIAALVYTFRVIAFFLWLADDTTLTRKQYYDWHTWSFVVLGLAGIAITIMKWIEWGHIPTWTLVSWVLNIGFNIYHIFSLKEFYELSAGIITAAEDTGDVADENGSEIMLSNTKLTDLRKRAIQLLEGME